MCIYTMYIFIESPSCYYYVDIESRFRVFADLVLGMDYHPNRYSVQFRISISGFEFGST
jgi:hypothetical protein